MDGRWYGGEQEEECAGVGEEPAPASALSLCSQRSQENYKIVGDVSPLLLPNPSWTVSHTSMKHTHFEWRQITKKIKGQQTPQRSTPASAVTHLSTPYDDGAVLRGDVCWELIG